MNDGQGVGEEILDQKGKALNWEKGEKHEFLKFSSTVFRFSDFSFLFFARLSICFGLFLER